MTYALRLSDDELGRYQRMAERARAGEAELWERAGVRPGAQVADVGCGPGAMLTMLAETVGPAGYVVGVDADEQAVAAANAALAATGLHNGEARVGWAEDTGLADGSFDVVVMRHVLSHNGGAEQRIVDHLARLARPGGHVYLVDVDLAAISMSPSTPDVEDLRARYLRWQTSRGNDLRIGLQLARFGWAAGLVVEEFRNWTETYEQPPGRRGPSWSARHAMVADSLATPADLERWDAAFDEIDSWRDRPKVMVELCAAVCLRPRR